MLVKEIMKKAMVLDKDISLKQASKLMTSKKISSLIFLENDKIKGILTEKDLIKNFGKNKKVSDIITKKVITITPEESTEKAIELMKKNKISILPVVDKNYLVGIISAKDILNKTIDSDNFLIE